MLTPEETLRIAKKLEAQGIDAAEQGRQRQLLGNKLWEFAMREFLLRDEPAEAGVMGLSGMTLRDYFAAKAMQADYAASQANKQCVFYRDVAERAYILADAMLKARIE